MKELTPYLVFDGNCREAMKFYEKCFNADLQFMSLADAKEKGLGAELQLMSFADAKVDSPPGAKDRIMHARLTRGPVVLMASDTMPGMPFTVGNNFSVSVPCENQQEIERLFAALSEGAKEVKMPLQETFWATRFGMLVDRFGIHWMFNLDKNP